MTGEPFRVPAVTDWSVPWHVRAGGDVTGGQVVLGEARLPPRTAGPNLHVHTREDEAGMIITGTLTVAAGDDVFDAGPGDVIWLPRGVPHTFANRTDDEVHLVGTIVPAGIEGLFEEQAAYFASLTGPPDESVVAEIGARYGVTIVGPPLDVT